MSADPQANPQILIVDDEPYVLDVIQRMLAPRFVAATASDGEQALRMLAEPECAIRLILLDLTMPGLAGAPMLRRLRNEHPRLRVVVMSGLTPEAAAPVLAGYVPDGYLAKPVRMASLLDLVARELGMFLG